jgi:hypothetical protein
MSEQARTYRAAQRVAFAGFGLLRAPKDVLGLGLIAGLLSRDVSCNKPL